MDTIAAATEQCRCDLARLPMSALRLHGPRPPQVLRSNALRRLTERLMRDAAKPGDAFQ